MCMYDTTGRTEDTTIGPSTHDEASAQEHRALLLRYVAESRLVYVQMCWHIVQYYPKQENLKCEGPVYLPSPLAAL